jgi:hypothetical protein
MSSLGLLDFLKGSCAGYKPGRKYGAAVHAGRTAILYIVGESVGHEAALESALQRYEDEGYDPRALTKVWIWGTCTNPTCSCGGANSIIRYDLHPVRPVEVNHF